MSAWPRGGSEGHCRRHCTSEGLSWVPDRRQDLQGPRGKSQGQRGHFWGHRPQLRMRKKSHLSVCPIQKFTGLLERVVSVSSPELCKERLDKFVAGMAHYGKEGGKRRHLTASEPRSCVITNQNSVTSEDFRLLLWGVKDTQQLYGCSELERPAPLGNPTPLRRRKH